MLTSLTQSDLPTDLLAQIFEVSTEGMVITDPAGIILLANKAFFTLFGYSPEELQGKNINILKSGKHEKDFFAQLWQSLHQTGGWQGNIWNKKKDGSLLPAWLFINAIYDRQGTITHFYAAMREISELKKRERQIAYLAYYDPLTHLPNRTFLERKLSKSIAHCLEKESLLAVFCLDIDNFNLINDVFGHSRGDMLLIQISQRLHSLLRKNDSLFRLGGDKFIYLLEGIDNQAAIFLMANRISAVLKEPFSFDGRTVFLNASIGISLCPGDGATVQELLRNADLAMHKAKVDGKNRHVLYNQSFHTSQQERFRTETGIRAGLQAGEFVVYYQPKIHIGTRKTAAMEALIRWKKNDQLVRPDLFIPVAEESDLIDEICLFVMEEVCSFLKTLIEHGVAVPISVNISPHQFHNLDFVDLTEDMLLRHSTDPDLFEFEITEGTVMQDANYTLRIMNELRQLGISLSIDDFGSGYSSLGYLSKMPVQTLKIDKQFIDELETNSGIVSTIIAICKQMQLNVVAEGVETEKQLTMLKELGCNEAQGFFFCPPVPAENALAYLLQNGTHRP